MHKLYAKLKAVTGYRDILLDDRKVDEFYRDLEIYPGNYLQSLSNFSLYSIKKKLKVVNESDYNDLWEAEADLFIPNAHFNDASKAVGRFINSIINNISNNFFSFLIS